VSLTAATTPEVLAEHGLSEKDLEAIVTRLGREPNLVELGIFSVMWSEHCAYRHSRALLKRLPTKGPRVLVGPGENAGAIDIGGGLCVVFKIESHNHPSAVEPYQGAATGVGGILRDIFTMGARPIALLDNLRFGDPGDGDMPRLIEGVVEGIAGYGNCIGVPTVAGDIMFDPAHGRNILVNAMCVGIAHTDDLMRAKAQGPGNAVLYFGSSTGRDGIHGATFASDELSSEALERRSAVQVGDPFMGKKILEATLALIAKGVVVGIQDMGAAGLTCSTCEMAGRAGTGMEIDLDHVPQRAEGMTAYEIMLSESQERMLAVCTPENVQKAIALCERWECGGAVIGEVTASDRIVVRHGGDVVADIPASALTDAPTLHPEEVTPAAPRPFEEEPSVGAGEIEATLLALLARPAIASKRWVTRRYDHMVQTNTVVRPGDGDAAVLRIKGEVAGNGEERFLAVSSDGNHRFVARDAFVGGQLAVCEAARNVTCVGAEPVGVTNCLNFGSPERPEVFGALRRCIEGIATSCESLGIPVTGGNVSLYNDSNGAPIPPTPIIGVVGLIGAREQITRPGFQRVGDAICVLGPAPEGVGGSEFAMMREGHDRPGEIPAGALPKFDLGSEVRLQSLTRWAIRDALIRSAHDVSEGGVAVAVAECCLASPNRLGASIDALPGSELAARLFGELPPRIVVSVVPGDLEILQALAVESDVACAVIGRVAGGGLRILGRDEIPIDALRRAYETVPTEAGP
jgi:phosphoribosylformylglycinamidine synthase